MRDWYQRAHTGVLNQRRRLDRAAIKCWRVF